MSSRSPAATAAIAAPAVARRRPFGRRLRRGAAPYALLLPAAAVIGAVLGYPLYYLVRLSFQHYGLFQLVRHKGEAIGTANYAQILHDGFFWHVVLRTLVFAAVCVVLTVVLGTLIALLLAEVGSFVRLLLTAGLIFAWATPVVVAVSIWSWMVDFEFGVLNWTLTELHVGDYTHHDWFANPWTGWAVIISLIVWGAIPFVAITLYAGLTQVSPELVEAASIDGASRWRVFRDITLPLLKPIYVIVISLSIIWDFQVFNQVWLILNGSPRTDYYLMAIYAYVESFKISEYGLGSAIAVVMVAIMILISFFYVREMVKVGEGE
ncbi:MAG TPA: sugar ABC transporter permease [Gaiellaceae bacterium]|jgi:N,N'-diacetylchitobiose transport system permease protein|nr:sugar ABC transporter permease [Gaiellaceae bacterium]